LKKKIIKNQDNLPKFIIGISSQSYDFQVVWSINSIIEKTLTKTKSLILKFKKDDNKEEIFEFSLFSYSDLDENKLYLLSNKDGGVYLYPKYKNIDYFFIIKSNELFIDDILKKITGEKFILGSFLIPVNNYLKKIINNVSSI